MLSAAVFHGITVVPAFGLDPEVTPLYCCAGMGNNATIKTGNNLINPDLAKCKYYKAYKTEYMKYAVNGVMLDFDLATLYEVETKVLNQSVKRNIKRFPEDFMFRLTAAEWNNMRSQFVTAYAQPGENKESNRSQIVTTYQNKRNTSVTPYAFTEQGVAMLSGILNSDKAINMNIAIMRAFVEIRKIFLQPNDLKEQLKEIKDRLGEHDVQLSQIYDAMENYWTKKQHNVNGQNAKELVIKNNNNSLTR